MVVWMKVEGYILSCMRNDPSFLFCSYHSPCHWGSFGQVTTGNDCNSISSNICQPVYLGVGNSSPEQLSTHHISPSLLLTYPPSFLSFPQRAAAHFSFFGPPPALFYATWPGRRHRASQSPQTCTYIVTIYCNFQSTAKSFALSIKVSYSELDKSALVINTYVEGVGVSCGSY